jgi:hypothetical protein
MNDGYVIYDKSTGEVYMTIKTEDPMMVLLNTPSNHEAIKTNASDFGLARAVDVKSKKIKITPQNK